MRIHFGHCLGCDQPIRPPYLSFVVSVHQAPTGNHIISWEDADVCDGCAAKLTVADLHQLVSEEEAEAGE